MEDDCASKRFFGRRVGVGVIVETETEFNSKYDFAIVINAGEW